MAERADGEHDPQGQAIHHDELNEFGEETWTALGENPEPVNTLVRGTSSENLRSWHDWDTTLQVVVGPMDSTEPRASSNLPLISQDSEETFENKDFLSEEVETLKSYSSMFDANAPSGGQKERSPKEVDEMACLSITTVVQPPSVASKPSSVRLRSACGEFCRICHEANFSENYISPCDCKGTLSLVHKSCLERWLAQSDTNHCELCGYTFTMVRIPKYGLLSSLIAWLTATSSWRERRKFLMDFMIFVIFCPIVGIFNLLAVRLADALFTPQNIPSDDPNHPDDVIKHPETITSFLNKMGQLSIFSMVATMNVTFFFWLVTRSQHHARKWYSWYRQNCIVELIGYPEVNISIKGEPSTTSSTNNIRSIAF